MAKKLKYPSLEYLLANFKYDPNTGDLFRNKTNRILTTNSHGYIVVRINKHTYGAHRIIWFMQTGQIPANEIDHINRNRSDNRWLNLREADKKEQQGNIKLYPTNTSGLRGVSWDKTRNKWSAQIHINSKKKSLGRFDSKEEAYSVYLKAAQKHFGEHLNVA